MGDGAAILILPDGRHLALSRERPITMGRDPECSVRINGVLASREHCRLSWLEGRWLIEDLGSRNGTVVNGSAVSAPRTLHDGDLVLAGGREFRFRLVSAGVPAPPISLSTLELDLGARGQARAAAVQRSLLGDLPTLPGWGLGASYHGAEGVSGDFYDATVLPSGRLLLVLGDISGHGVAAALAMTALLKSLRHLRGSAASVEDLVIRLNREVGGDLPPGYFATLWALDLDPASGRGRCICAGHHPAMLIPGDPAQPPRPVGLPGLALGMLQGPDFAGSLQPADVRLLPGDRLVQCSDGVIEAGSGGPEDGLLRLGSDVAAAGDLPAQDLAQAIAGGAEARSGASRDDITVLVLARERSQREVGDSSDTTRHAGGALLAAVAALPRRLASAEDGEADYRLGPVIGAGAAGVVHEAVQRVLERTVAVKRAARPDAETETEILRETIVAAALDHPHVLPVHDLGRDPSLGVFFAMRRPQGRTWREALPGLGLERNLDVLLAVSDACACAHAQGIIHRDVKPDNVLVGDDGAVYLFDWGVAAACPGAAPHIARVLPPPRSGMAVGTPAYMAPEMARGEGARIGPASDVYLLGAVLIEILIGEPPRSGAELAGLLAAAGAGRLPELDADEPLSAIAARACDPDPSRRWPDARAFRGALAECRSHRQSLRLAGEAARLIARGAEADADTLLRARVICEQALLLWPGNRAAADSLVEARRLHALLAIGHGDLDLAASLLDPALAAHADALIQLGERRSELRRQLVEFGRLRQLHARTERVWRVLRETVTDSPAVFSAWEHRGASCAATDGGCYLFGNLHGFTALAPGTCQGDVRIEARLRRCAHPNATAGLIIRTASATSTVGYDGVDGHSLIVEVGAATTFHHGRQRLWSGPGVETGRWFDLALECEGPTLRISIDGAVLFSCEVSRLGQMRVGLITRESALDVALFRLSTLAPPQVEDPLLIAERHLRMGHQRTALDLAEEILASDPDDARRLAAGNLRTQALTELALRNRHQAASERLALHLPAAAIGVRDGLLCLSVPAGTPGDLHALAGTAIGELSWCRGGLEDLGPLRGMPLQRLELTHNRISDLAPLARLPLRMLLVSHNPVTDLGPLADCPLEQLDISQTRVASLAGLPASLVFLSLANIPIATLDQLAHLRLSELWVAQCPFESLEPLRGMPLLRLGMMNTRARDLEPLRGMPLRHLFLDWTLVRDLEPLRGMALRGLNLGMSQVEDLEPLRGMPLELLTLTGCEVRSLAPLAGMPLRRLIYGPTVPEGLDLLPPTCVATYRPVKPPLPA